MRKHLPYTSAASLLVIERVLEKLAFGPADTNELIAATGRTGPRARPYIRHLAEAGRIYCLEPQGHVGNGGTTPTVWALEPTPFVPTPEEVDDTVDTFQRKVIVRQQWAPHHVRMPLECLLFGVPDGMRGMGA